MDFDQLLGLSTLAELEWYQMALRAVVVFIVALAIIRITGMRAFGTRSAFDIVLSITIGAILSRCITGHYPFFPCILAAFTLACCHRLISFLVFHFESIQALGEGRPVLLFHRGKVIKENAKSHLISDEDMDKALREKGLDDTKSVKSMWFEIDGKISVVKNDD